MDFENYKVKNIQLTLIINNNNNNNDNNKDSYSTSIPKFKGALQYREKLNKYLKIKNIQTKNFQTDQ